MNQIKKFYNGGKMNRVFHQYLINDFIGQHRKTQEDKLPIDDATYSLIGYPIRFYEACLIWKKCSDELKLALQKEIDDMKKQP